MTRATFDASRQRLQLLARELSQLGVKDLRTIEQVLRRRRRALSAEFRREASRLGGQARARALTKAERQASARKAGRARRTALSPERRRQIARKAIRARWAKVRRGQRAAAASTPSRRRDGNRKRR